MLHKEPAQAAPGINQYCAPLCYELSGSSYFLRFDDGSDLYVNILDGRFLLLGAPGSAPSLERYCCMKSDDATYFLHIDRVKPSYSPVTLALDFDNRLFTCVDSGKGSAALSHWFTAKVRFGYIDMPGRPAPAARHELSSEPIGLKIEWRYNDQDCIYHIYMPDGNVRLGLPPAEELSPRRRQLFLDRVDKGTDLFEEPVLFVKLKDNKFLTIFCECNMAHVDPGSGGGGILLMDFDKLSDVGIFHTVDASGRESYTPVSAFGKFTDRVFPQETMPSRYKTRYGVDGRRVWPAEE